MPAAKPVPADIMGKIIFYAIRASQIFFNMINSLGEVGGWFKRTFNKIMALWGFRHFGALLHFFLDPVFKILKSIGIAFQALL